MIVASNTQNRDYLRKLIAKDEIPHTLLFAGASMVEVVDIAKELLGSVPHPDLYFVRPEGKLGVHAIEALRNMRDVAFSPPFQGRYKIFIIQDADRMQTASANALLKTFEEPLPTTLIFLVSDFPEKILPTVRSRCQTLYYQTNAQGITTQVRPLLAALDSVSHFQLLEKVGQISDELEKNAAAVREEEEMPDTLTPYQKEAYEKELEGERSLALTRLLRVLFEDVLGWFRDLHLLQVGGDPGLLMHPESKEDLQKWLARGKLLPLDSVQATVQQAKLALERSNSLRSTLESLFLQLQQKLTYL